MYLVSLQGLRRNPELELRLSGAGDDRYRKFELRPVNGFNQSSKQFSFTNMASSSRGDFEIHEAARQGRLEHVESLLNANSRLATKVDDDERLPIHWAVSYSHLPIVELLASRKDFDPDVQVTSI